MRRGVLYGRELELAGSPLTLHYFREEFGESLMFFLAKAYAPPVDPEEFLRIAWALNKTVKPDIDGYEDWLNEFPDEAFDLGKGTGDAIDVILSVIDTELFRGRPTIPQRIGDWTKRIGLRLKRWAAGRLDRIRLYFGA